MNPLMESFINESRDTLAMANQCLLALETAPTDRGHLDELFRAMHTLKGACGFFDNLHALSQLLHISEDRLDQLRSQQHALTPTLTDTLFASLDVISHWVEYVAEHGELPDDAAYVLEHHKQQLLAALPGSPAPDAGDTANNGEAELAQWLASLNDTERQAAVAALAVQQDTPSCAIWAVQWRNAADCFFHDDDPVDQLRRLPGVLTFSVDSPSPWPALAELDPFFCQLRCRALVVSDEATLRQHLTASEQLVCRPLSEDQLRQPPATEADAGPASPATAEPQTSANGASIRVEQQRIDDLMTLVGELIVAKNGLPFLAAQALDGVSGAQLAKELNQRYAHIDRIVSNLQNTVMGARMVPFSVVFQRFPRLVRDLARKLDKQVQLELDGEDTQADKHVVDSLSEPLMHLIRNSLDHAIEPSAERLRAGKPEAGRVHLRAQAQDDQVLIEVSDDGRGIDVAKLKAKALQRGLIDQERHDNLADNDALQLIFAAGLSTAEQVSDVSGRGVGMDAVRAAVTAAGGHISLTSELGIGTTFRLLLPLSMAVTRVMVVDVAGQDYGIPMANICETVRLPQQAIQRIKQQETIVLRDKLVPLWRLRDQLGLPAAPAKQEEAILIVEYEGQWLGLVVDGFRQGLDIVQKPMDGIMAAYPLYAGSALMGDGRVLLVLSLPNLLHDATKHTDGGPHYVH